MAYVIKENLILFLIILIKKNIMCYAQCVIIHAHAADIAVY